MKVVCINSSTIRGSGNVHLTKDKVYDVIDKTPLYKSLLVTHYWIADDRGREYEFFIERFVKLEDIREDKLNSILG
jgi:hypothetical protein